MSQHTPPVFDLHETPWYSEESENEPTGDGSESMKMCWERLFEKVSQLPQQDYELDPKIKESVKGRMTMAALADALSDYTLGNKVYMVNRSRRSRRFLSTNGTNRSKYKRHI